MSKISRRDFLKVLPTVPFYKIAWSQAQSAIAKTPLQLGDSPRPNILFIVFDTLSAHHVSLFGYDRDTTPNFARFAERATVFHQHRSTANFTSSATSSIFTGTHPWTHRAFHLHGTIQQAYADKNLFRLLPDDYYKVAYTHNLLVASLLHQFGGEIDLFKQTRDLCLADNELADVLFNRDYNAAFWGESTALRGGATPPGTLYLALLDRLHRFATKRELEGALAADYPRGVPNLHSLFFLLEDAIDWIGEQVAALQRPFLGYFHLLPPHEPYAARADFVDIYKSDGYQPTEKPQSRFGEKLGQDFLNWQRREYDEYLAFTDAEFGRLLDKLEQDGVLDDTYVILTSDHGEMFERGIRGHVTLTLYEPLLHVPLLIAQPGQTQRVDVTANTSSVDLLPTLLHLTGQAIPDWVEGQILPPFAQAMSPADRPIYGMEAKSNPKMAPLNKVSLSLTRDNYKLTHYLGYMADAPDGIYELYDLAADPQELHNLYAADHPVAAALKAELADKRADVNRPFQR